MLRSRALVFGLLLLLQGCDLSGPRAEVQFTIPRERFHDFLDVPWPSDVLRTEDGLDLSAFPNPFNATSIDDYVGLFARAPGYASSGALYFRVDGGVDEDSLPASPRDSMQADSSMFLVELASPHERLPIEWRTYPDGTSFMPPGSVAVLPLLGATVKGPAALVVTSAARSLDGRALGASPDQRALMACAPLDGVERAPDCTPYQKLVTDLGLSPSEVALVQLYTPADATTELVRAYQLLRDSPPPRIKNLAYTEDDNQYSQFALYTGTVGLAQFQQGEAPFTRFDGHTGGFEIDDDGVPVVQRIEEVELVLTVPIGAPPERGWPIVINGHGTTGSLYSGVGQGPANEAHQLARAGCAMLSVSEPLHAGRDGYVAGSDDTNTFNFLNPLAGRDIWRQSALEKVQLVSAAKTLALPAAVAGREVLFDPDQVHYFGHSQGGIVGAIFVGVEQRIGGAFLSGAGGGFAPSIIDKREPFDLRQVLRTLVGLPADETVDRFHPIPNLMQIWVEPLEPLNYGPLWRDRPDGHTPHLVATSGLLDEYTPPRNHAGLAAAFGLPTIEPVGEHLEVVELLGISPVRGPVAGNQRDARGEPLTAGLLQYPNDGHFAVFYNPDAQEAYRLFFESVQTGVPVAKAR